MTSCITRIHLWLLGLILVGSTACGGGGELRPSNHFVKLELVARSLDLRITRSSTVSRTLENDQGRVLVIGPPNETVMVNGKKLPGAHVHIYRGTFWIHRGLVPVIRKKLEVPIGEFSGRVVMLDAGHGGRDPGAPNAWGPSEKHVVLDITLRAAELLKEHGVTVQMTRDGDTYPTLDERVAQANRLHPELFVSIHADSAPAPEAQGFTVYISRQASRASQLAAESMVEALTAIGTRNRGVKRANFRVITKTTCPAILVESGYLSNAQEAQRLSRASHRQRVAEAIAQGVMRHLSAVQG